MKHRKIKKYGWKKDLPDFRDMKLAPPAVSNIPLPTLIDLRPNCPGIYDQGQLGSCTANAIGAAFEFELLRQKLNDFVPSRLFIYWNERNIEGDTSQDNGAQIRDGMSVISTLGVCPEVEWPYDISQFAIKPLDQCYVDALLNTAIQYLSVDPDLISLKSCLASGFPFVMGITVYNSFESEAVATTGMVPIPTEDDSVVGGHAVCVVGYDDSKNCFIVRNSWGTGWGLEGYFYLPYDYVVGMGLASDFWTVRSVK